MATQQYWKRSEAIHVFGGHEPLDMARASGEQRERVLAILGGIEHGIF